MKKLKKVISAVLMVSMIGVMSISGAAKTVVDYKTVNKYGKRWVVKYSISCTRTMKGGFFLYEGEAETTLTNGTTGEPSEVISAVELVGYTTGDSYGKFEVKEKNGLATSVAITTYPVSWVKNGENLTAFGAHNIWSKQGLVFREYTNVTAPKS